MTAQSIYPGVSLRIYAVTRLVMLLTFLSAGLSLFSGCIPVMLTAATVTAIDVATDRRTVGRNIDDNSVELRLRKDYLLDKKLGSAVNISVTSMNGIVLLTGEVATDEQRKRALLLARSYEETRQVVNELDLSGKTNVTSRANDSWITGKVKTALVTAKNLSASNIKVVTERGHVYLLGLVTRTESEAAVEAAKDVKGVTHIIKVFEYI